jgi:hypothetical protein
VTTDCLGDLPRGSNAGSRADLIGADSYPLRHFQAVGNERAELEKYDKMGQLSANSDARNPDVGFGWTGVHNPLGFGSQTIGGLIKRSYASHLRPGCGQHSNMIPYAG